MEPRYTFAAKPTEFTRCKCDWLPHHKQFHDRSDEFCAGRDQFWEGQWYSDASEWVAFNKHAQFVLDSPLASASLSSVSTRESSIFSWNSEHGQAAAAVTQGLLSPEALSRRFSGFSLFNSRIGHGEEMACGTECAGPLACEIHLCETSSRDDTSIKASARNSTVGSLCDGWVSDSIETQSCLSTPSPELSKEERIKQVNDMPIGRQAKNIPSSRPCNNGELPFSMGVSASLHLPLRPGDAERPLSYAKSRYSAAVKENFTASTLHGFLRFAEQGGSPCYSFFVDDSDEVLFARASRQEWQQSNKENCEWTYTFHSKKDSGKAKAPWKGWPKKEILASDLVGSMRVPVTGKAKKSRDGHANEAHFVLYDGRDRQIVEAGPTGAVKQHAQPLKQVCNNKARFQGGYGEQRGEHCCRGSDARKSSSGRRDACMERYRTCHHQQAELAAVVISTSVREERVARGKEGPPPPKEVAGWGVKFLDKGSECARGTSFTERPSLHASSSEKIGSVVVPDACKPHECVGAKRVRTAHQSNAAQMIQSHSSCPRPDFSQKPDTLPSNERSRLTVDVTVILPAGDHGLPTEDEEDGDGASFCNGPTPLLERLASGGDCACGGWDMGCGLSVLRAETLDLRAQTANIALTRNDRMNWLTPRSPFRILTQDYTQKKVLVIEMVEAGLFSLSFQARLSPLQAFFIAVTLFHQQMMDA